jgi:hypothetical protein
MGTFPYQYHDSKGNYHEFPGCIPLNLHDFREVDANGDVGAIAANGGILASDTTPLMRGASALIAQEISWAASNVDPILIERPLPPNFDGRDDVWVELWVYSGTTNLASFTVATSWDGGATVSDTATDPAASATVHKVTAVIAAADIPDGATHVTLMLTPAAHGTDAVQLRSARLLHGERVKAA